MSVKNFHGTSSENISSRVWNNKVSKISAIIVAYNSEKLIMRCLNAALEAGVSNVYVWDNSPSRGSIAVLADIQDERLTLLSDGYNHGFGGGINRTLERGITDDLVLLINPDCFVTAEVTRELSLILEDANTAVAAPRMVYENGLPGIAGGPFPTVAKEFLGKLRVDEIVPRRLKLRLLGLFASRTNGSSLSDSLVEGDPIAVDWVSGFCMMLRKDVLMELRGFDEDYFLYFEDVDVCRRAIAAGYTVKLARRTSALHLESTSTSAVGKSAHYYRGLTVYMSKHGTRRQIRAAKLLGLTR